MLVSITADWCITCIANEQLVLGKAEFQELLGATETLYMKGDWTNSDPVVGEFLEQHHAPGVSLYVLYRGMDDQATVLLPQALTMQLVREALENGADRKPNAGKRRLTCLSRFSVYSLTPDQYGTSPDNEFFGSRQVD